MYTRAHPLSIKQLMTPTVLRVYAYVTQQSTQTALRMRGSTAHARACAGPTNGECLSLTFGWRVAYVTTFTQRSNVPRGEPADVGRVRPVGDNLIGGEGFLGPLTFVCVWGGG